MGSFSINGVGTSSGGKYEDVNINGVGNIRGPLDCQSIGINGVGTIDGDLKCVSGSVNGTARISGSVSAERFEVRGMMTLKGSLEAESFYSYGAFDITELLSADKIDIAFSHHSHAGEVGGKNVKIRRKDVVGFFVLTRSPKAFTASVIEADSVDIEYSEVGTVRADNAVIGPGCKIDRVEYRASCEVSKSANVREAVRVGNPEGL